MLDPVSSLSAPPPRYLLESDSSDEEGQGVYPSGQRKRATTTPAVSVKWLDEAVPATSVVVGLGQAGKYLARRANARMAVLSVDVDGHTVGTGFSLGDDLLVQLADSDEKGEAACGVVEQLTKLVSAQSWIVYSSYVPALYIPNALEEATPDLPIRYISTTTVNAPTLRQYDAPNYLTGIASEFLSQATHPAFPLQDVTVFLLPLPLSLLSPKAYTATLATLSPSIRESLTKPANWTEADDERYTGIGMGRKPNREIASAAPDLGGMYM